MRATKDSNDGQKAEQPERRASAWVTLAIAAAIASVAVIGPSAQGRGSEPGRGKGRAHVDRELTDRMKRRGDSDRERVIVTAKPGRLGRLLEQLKGQGVELSNDLSLIEGVSGDLPVGLLRQLADHPDVVGLSTDAKVRAMGVASGISGTALNSPYSLRATLGLDRRWDDAHVPTGGERLLRRRGRQRRQPGADGESRRAVVRVDGRRTDGRGGHAAALRESLRQRREPDSGGRDDHVGVAQGRTLRRRQQQRDCQPAPDADAVVG